MGEEQTCAVPGSSMVENVMLIRDMAEYAKSNNKSLVLESVDLEKAFDKVVHGFLFAVLRCMGFPEHLVGVLQGLYEGVRSRVLVNGVVGESFEVKSGVRQGCPLSPQLFILAIEPLLKVVRGDKVAQGFLVPGSGGVRVKSCAYMDDVVFVSENGCDLQRINLHLRRFCCVSGMSVNWEKCWVCVLGKKVRMEEGRMKVVEKLKVLGLWFDNDLKGKVNYEELKARINKILGLWRLRSLSLRGRALIVKTYVLPLILHVSNVFPPPKMWVSSITQSIFVFFGGVKCEKCSHEKVLKPYEKGGYGFPDLILFLRLHFWLTCRRVLKGEGRATLMGQYLFGRYVIKWGWIAKDLCRPVAFCVPQYYLRLVEIRQEWGLEQLGEEDGSKAKIIALREKEMMTNNISELRGEQVEDTWRKFKIQGLLNRQRDLVWAALMGTLPTRAYLKQRDLAVTERCPRRECGSTESVYHVFWACDFAQRVRSKAMSLLKLICGVNVLSYTVLLTGWVDGSTERILTVWLTMALLKQVIWEARESYTKQKKVYEPKEVVELLKAKLYAVFLFDQHKEGDEIANSRWKVKQW